MPTGKALTWEPWALDIGNMGAALFCTWARNIVYLQTFFTTETFTTEAFTIILYLA
ncbi:hypothetical protein TRIATDRAFT_254490 [Trichoderma atroviride IMI 206040]|uniref:Uncharacterized protein n=1 Tax=Hypocrea atroviridis (strain ATCC 20476 / IMI 206040) TaxID=452589 RepID=G9NGE3_HYPAI|nr:uncharacterized protein TRIATDRAFT_254490 [Trichoderma atroviride IMI 206040]EHK50355.1 hypothetical protein TRIATDRAFT_254490 [Trichoderma atroviride IMI 206040]